MRPCDTNNTTKEVLSGVKVDLLSTIITWLRDLEATNHADKNTPTNWTKEDFMLWRRNKYNVWKKSGAAANSRSTVSMLIAVLLR